MPKARKVKPLDYTYTGNIYILPVRAMNEFLLKPRFVSAWILMPHFYG